MQLTADFVGASLKEYTGMVNARKTMNDAAAVGDADPRCFNDERPDGILINEVNHGL